MKLYYYAICINNCIEPVVYGPCDSWDDLIRLVKNLIKDAIINTQDDTILWMTSKKQIEPPNIGTFTNYELESD
jgi:hypothetical protein